MKATGLTLAGGILLRSIFAQTAKAGSASGSDDQSQLGSVFSAALANYLARPDASQDLYMSYLGVAPKLIPTVAEQAWAEVGPGILASVLKSGVLRFGYAETPPYVYHGDNGELAGLDWELGNALTPIIREQYASYAPGIGLRAEWIKVTVPSAGDPEMDKFNALYSGLSGGLFDIAMSGQANISSGTNPTPAVLAVDWSPPTELLFTNILYSGLGNLKTELARLVGGSRDAFIAEIQSLTTDAIFMCVVNEGPSMANTQALVAAIGDRAALRTGNLAEITDAISNQTIHFSVGDAVASSYQGNQPGFRGLNLNIAAATDPLGTAAPVCAFTMGL